MTMPKVCSLTSGGGDKLRVMHDLPRFNTTVKMFSSLGTFMFIGLVEREKGNALFSNGYYDHTYH